WWAKSELKLAARINESYHDAGPLRVLGRLAARSPRFLGGSRKQSWKYYDRALEIAPHNTVTLLYAAELALAAGDSTRAVTFLDLIQSLPDDPEWEYENGRDRDAARALVSQIAAV